MASKWTDKSLDNTLGELHQFMRLDLAEAAADQNRRATLQALRQWIDAGFEKTVIVDPTSSHGAYADGSSARPYASIQTALTAITDASSSKQYLIRVLAGTITESITCKPYISVAGVGRKETKLTGNVTITGTDVGTITFSDITLNGNLTLANTGSVACELVFNNVYVTGTFSLTGRGAGSDSCLLQYTDIVNTTTLAGMGFTCRSCSFSGDLTITEAGAVTDTLGYIVNAKFYACILTADIDATTTGANTALVVFVSGRVISGTTTLTGNGVTALYDAVNYPDSAIVIGGGVPTTTLLAMAANIYADNSANCLTAETVQGQLDELASYICPSPSPSPTISPSPLVLPSPSGI